MPPYWNNDFFEFFITFALRLWGFITGDVSLQDLTSDEKQLLALLFSSITLSWLGSFIILNRLSMFSNSLSHTLLMGIVMVFWLQSKYGSGLPIDISNLGAFNLLLSAVISALVTAGCVFLLKKYTTLHEDASIALVFTALFALGITLVTLLTRSAHLGIEAVMGDIEALQITDINRLFVIFLFTVAFLLLFYHRLLALSFDFAFAEVGGLYPRIFYLSLLMLCSISLVGSFRTVGVILVLSLLTAPYLMARGFAFSLKKILILTLLISLLSSFISVALSRHLLTVYGLALSTSGLFVSLLSLSYLILLFFSKRKTQALTVPFGAC